MAESSQCSSGMAESEITAMKETLRAQQQLLQQLHSELDEEREASSSAASEALDMILRLQGEKAAVKMEASHYKRMAEEKIVHAETTLEIFEELMYQKEMEIASLEFQVQAYRHKLLSLGCDLTSCEFKYPENLLTQRNDQNNAENGPSSTVRRLNSLPPISFKNMRATLKGERSPSPIRDGISKIVEESTDQEVVPQSLDPNTHESLDTYWNQIKRLDEKVKEISDCKESEGEKCANLESRIRRSSSLFSQASVKPNLSQIDGHPPISPYQANHCEAKQDREAVGNPSSSMNVHDVFEVPPTGQKRKARGKKRNEKLKSETDSRLTKPDPVPEGMVESNVKHESDKLKGMVSPNNDINVANPNDTKTTTGLRRYGSMDCSAQSEFQKLFQRVERLERERISTRQEITPVGCGEEQLRLLKDIQDRLKLLQTEIRDWKAKKAPPQDDGVCLAPLQEAMLCFWI